MQHTKIRSMVIIGLNSAILCILGPLSLPIGPVPISLTNLVIYFSLYLLGAKQGTLSYLIYVLLGLVGLPVFSGFSGGPGKLLGPTGGYIIGFFFLCILSGKWIEQSKGKLYPSIFAMLLGTLICYFFGTLWLSLSAHMDLWTSCTAGVLPFIPGDFIKILIAAILGPQLNSLVKKSYSD